MIAFFDVGADMSKLQANDLNRVQEFTKNQLMADFDVLFDTANLPNPLNEASRYAISNGGKRVRPLLVLATFLAAGGCVDMPVFGAVRRAMLAIECVHGYSLVHDDLPSMDDDELRRGKPTCHVVYGEGVAVLTGDVLQSLAFDVLGGEYELGAVGNDVVARLLGILAPNARHMVAGQQADLNGEQKQLNQTELEAIHKGKTGALIVASVLMGAVCGGASDERMASLGEYARLIGLAYQVQDDVLDVVADTQTLGKMAGSDEKLDKSTYVKLLGVDNARAYADELFDKARKLVSDLGDDNLLLQMVDWLQKRNY
ncbi:polyprenyl synthetase family protein [Moraxella bovis]|uniref:polyprenyl synthetase family protein n=1 Tax=Moraxella bovis TaxID=476 RepID=UPI0022269267|nr:farnesyl diphosphate synthase [Moraxella bovis]UYZ68162.1 polyprenyl synthetase family protein [Moraxella bovis]UYZ70544.1 polyprenyl synthetase family protein [Moraxella bovis]UYZ73536.1 polyprenyl synthetase family protein [Moraxella bovis]UYZ80880.1 polyprenyl synthetase family protein [Moraxella bovis]UZA06548.1 polyprenyl synthetase family protein [Moraxella bovis]